MKVRDSGMPEETYWESLFDIPEIIERMAVTTTIDLLVEFGCGYGTFTLPVARTIRGNVVGLDLDPLMLSRTEERLAPHEIDNIRLIERDFVSNHTGLESDSADYVMLFNILHHERPEVMVGEARRILRTGGTVGIIHWRSDIVTPRGPDMDIRPTPEALVECCRNCGLAIRDGWPIILRPWHFGILATKA